MCPIILLGLEEQPLECVGQAVLWLHVGRGCRVERPHEDLVLGDGVGRLLDFDQAHGAEGAAEERVLVADAHHLAMAADAQALQVQRSAVDPLHDRCQRKAKPTRLLSP